MRKAATDSHDGEDVDDAARMSFDFETVADDRAIEDSDDDADDADDADYADDDMADVPVIHTIEESSDGNEDGRALSRATANGARTAGASTANGMVDSKQHKAGQLEIIIRPLPAHIIAKYKVTPPSDYVATVLQAVASSPSEEWFKVEYDDGRIDQVSARQLLPSFLLGTPSGTGLPDPENQFPLSPSASPSPSPSTLPALNLLIWAPRHSLKFLRLAPAESAPSTALPPFALASIGLGLQTVLATLSLQARQTFHLFRVLSPGSERQVAVGRWEYGMTLVERSHIEVTLSSNRHNHCIRNTSPLLKARP